MTQLTKTFSIVFLLMCYFLGTLRPIAPLVKYQLKKNYYIQVLCQQRNQINNTCQGTCHLKKEIKKEVENPNRPSFFVDFEKYPIGFVSFIMIEKPSFFEKKKRFFSYFKKIDSLHLSSIFHPPQYA